MQQGKAIRQRRNEIGIPGHVVCGRAGIGRSRLSDIEREYVQPSMDELARIARALDELALAKQKLTATAQECGWPTATL
jgi:transcriptional regulator with XRE-family HTH domain